jgi:hypothetical protein
MYVLQLTLLVTIMHTRVTFVDGRKILLFRTAHECATAAPKEMEMLMARAIYTMRKLNKAIHAEVHGGCKPPRELRSVGQSSGNSDG